MAAKFNFDCILHQHNDRITTFKEQWVKAKNCVKVFDRKKKRKEIKPIINKMEPKNGLSPKIFFK